MRRRRKGATGNDEAEARRKAGKGKKIEYNKYGQSGPKVKSGKATSIGQKRRAKKEN